MCAGVSTTQYSEEILGKVTAFAATTTANATHIPAKDKCIDSSFTGNAIPQKYAWCSGIYAPFVMFTDMNGKTLPELWDDIAGAGFTEHTGAQIQAASQQLMINTVAPEIVALLEKDITEEMDQEAWTIAMGKVMYRNLNKAKEKHQLELPVAVSGTSDPVLAIE